jgi:hypothetical protein
MVIQIKKPLHPGLRRAQRALAVGLVGGLTATSMAWAQARFLPSTDRVVLPVSRHTLGQVSQDLKAAEQAWQRTPQDLGAATRYARQAFLVGVTEGDLRWLGSAKAALLPWWTQARLSADGHFLRGLVKQGFHDFEGGLADIDAAIALDDTQAEFWSWRFAIHLLWADMSSARADCEAMGQRFGAQEARACQAILAYRTGQATAAVQSLRALTSDPSFQGDLAQDWLQFHLGEAQRTAGQVEAAVATWSGHLARRPRTHAVRLALVELLNAQGRYGLARRWAEVPNPSDALLVQQLLASQGQGDADTSRLKQQVEARMATQAQRNDGLIERPTLVYLIRHGHDVAAGLALAQKNWGDQKEPPDAVLLLEAALKLDRPEAATPVLDWMARTGYTDPVLAALAAQVRSRLRL